MLDGKAYAGDENWAVMIKKVGVNIKIMIDNLIVNIRTL